MNNKMYCGECKDFHYGPPDKIQRMIFNCSRRAKQLSNELKAVHNELRYMKLLTKTQKQKQQVKKKKKQFNLNLIKSEPMQSEVITVSDSDDSMDDI